MQWPSRLSFNQFTTTPRPISEWLDEAVRAGVPAIGLSRGPVESFGYEQTLRLVRDAGLPVTIYTSIGFWAGGRDHSGQPWGLNENLKYLDRAAELGASIVSVSSGRMNEDDKDLEGARERVVEGIAELIPYAVERNLKLAMEPLHPLFCPNMGVLITLKEAMDTVEALNHECVGISLDMFHTWWDPDLVPQLRRALKRIWIVQVNDWFPGLPILKPLDRAMMGEGCADFSKFMDGLEGYDGWFDVETNNDELRALPVPELLNRCREAFEKTIGHRLAQPAS